jgi:beta-xylosidase
MFKKDGKYYFMWSEGGWGGPDYKVAYAIADNPLGPFERIGTILEQDPEIATGAGHHSIIHNLKMTIGTSYTTRRPEPNIHRDHRVTCN